MEEKKRSDIGCAHGHWEKSKMKGKENCSWPLILTGTFIFINAIVRIIGNMSLTKEKILQTLIIVDEYSDWAFIGGTIALFLFFYVKKEENMQSLTKIFPGLFCVKEVCIETFYHVHTKLISQAYFESAFQGEGKGLILYCNFVTTVTIITSICLAKKQIFSKNRNYILVMTANVLWAVVLLLAMHACTKSVTPLSEQMTYLWVYCTYIVNLITVYVLIKLNQKKNILSSV